MTSTLTSPATRKLAAIMFTDMVGYTTMMQEDEARAIQLRERQKAVLINRIKKHEGDIIQYYGDGTLCLFRSAKEAVLAAKEIQEDLQEEPKVPLRIGIHIGDIIQDHEGVYGDGVNLASRIESLSVPGAVLFSDTVQNQLKNHPGIQSISLGAFKLKNVQNAIEVFALSSDKIKAPERIEINGKTADPNRRSMVVLPFENMSADAENAYFCDGLTEEIINGLSKVKGLDIISRSSSFALKGTRESAKEIGKRLEVSHVLVGSVRKANDRIRITVQLSKAFDGYQLWSEVYDRQFHNIFDVQDEIAKIVVNRMKENLDLQSHKQPIITRPTENIEAYNTYLKGLHHFNKWNADDIQKAIRAFEDTARIDPNFAGINSSLSHCYSFLGSCGFIQPVKAYTKAYEYALASIENNSSHAESHLALAMIKIFHFWDWKGGAESLQKAEQQGLDNALFNQIYALYLAAVGEIPEAVKKMERAVKLDPLSVPMICLLGHLYLFAEEYELANKQYDLALELDPSCRAAFESKGMVYMTTGEIEKSIEFLLQYQRMTNHPLKGVTGLVWAYAATGDRETALSYLEKMKTRQQQEPETALELDFAFAYFGLGDHEKGFDYLNQAYEKRFGMVCTGMVFALRWPLLKTIREKPAFKALKEKMGLEK